MILGLHHVAIATTNLDVMLRFYNGLLGFEVVAEGNWDKGSARHDALVALENSAARYLVLRCGSSYVELFAYSSPLPSPGDVNRPVSDAGITHLCLAVDDIDHEYARLEHAGVRFHTAPGPKGPMRATYGRDPDGNVFELIEFSDPEHPFRFHREQTAA